MSLNDTRTIETTISTANVKDQIGALLYALGFVKDDEDILDLRLGETKNDNVPLSYTIIKKKEVKVYRHN